MYRLLRGHYSSVFAPTDSCVNPVWLSPTSAFGLVREVFAGCYQPLLLPGFSRRYFCESFLRCPSPYPGGLLSAFAWFFPSIHRPSPSFDWVSFPLPSVNTTFHGSAFEAAAISLCSGLRVCSPPRSFLPLQVPLQGSRGFLHPSRTCVVTFARIGHAIRPTTGNWRNENFHLARFAALSAATEWKPT